MNPSIRQVSLNDAPGILEIYAPFVKETAVTFEEEIPSVREIEERIKQIYRKLPYLVCEMEGKVAGYAYAVDFRSRAAYRWIKELSVYIHPDFRHRNIASALYSCLIDLLKLQGITSVLACITVPNPESVGFHEKSGFTKVGIFQANGFKLGQWHNVGWWELHLLPVEVAPCDQPLAILEIPEKEKQETFRKGMEMLKF